MTLEFQPLEHEWQWAEAARLSSQFWPEDPVDAERLRIYANEFPSDKFIYRAIAVQSGVPVAYVRTMEAYWLSGGNRCNFHISPDRSSNMIEVYRLCLDHALEIIGATHLAVAYSTIRSDELEIIDHLTKNGFAKGQVNPVSFLPVPGFDSALHADIIDRVKGEGYEILNLSQLREKYPDDWSRRLYEADMTISQDVPMPEPFEPISFDHYLAMINSPAVNPESYFMVLKDGEVAAFTELDWNTIDRTLANTGLTGVRREHRRKGLATALKAVAIEWAKSVGIERIVTDNEENNPMYQLNLNLGYQKLRYIVDYSKTL